MELSKIYSLPITIADKFEWSKTYAVDYYKSSLIRQNRKGLKCMS